MRAVPVRPVGSRRTPTVAHRRVTWMMLCNVLRVVQPQKPQAELAGRSTVWSCCKAQQLAIMQTTNIVVHALAQGDVGAGTAGVGAGMAVFMQALLALCSSCTDLLHLFPCAMPTPTVPAFLVLLALQRPTKASTRPTWWKTITPQQNNMRRMLWHSATRPNRSHSNKSKLETRFQN